MRKSHEGKLCVGVNNEVRDEKGNTIGWQLIIFTSKKAAELQRTMDNGRKNRFIKSVPVTADAITSRSVILTGHQ
jgi:hypothetical protein